MAPEELFSQLSLWMVNLCLKYFSFCIYFILYLHVWIRTYRAPEFESHTGPDPHPQCCRWLGNFANEKIKQAKNILFPWTATASPATIDFCINLDRDFESLVVDKLCKTSRDAFLQQLDPASMPDTVRTKTRREITHTLYGNILYTYIEISVAEPDPVGSGTFFLDPELFVPDLDQARMKEQFNKIFIYNFKAWRFWTVILYCRTAVWNRKWQIPVAVVGRFFFLTDFKLFFYK